MTQKNNARPWITRRRFMGELSAGAVVLAALPSRAQPDAPRRTIWICSDTHVGKEFNGTESLEWAREATADIAQLMGKPDYVLCLGDVTHRATVEQFEAYASWKKDSGFSPWFEIVGNHDYRAVSGGYYAEFARRERHYVVLDGNIAWIMVSSDKGGGMPVIKGTTRDWLDRVTGEHQDKNVIVCTHYPVANTVYRSNPDPEEDLDRVLQPLDWIEAYRAKHRIDGWLIGHVHSKPRGPRHAVRVGQTSFINVSSITHAYGNGTNESFVFETEEGSSSIRARCRHHEKRAYRDQFGVEIPLPSPVKLGDRVRIADVLQDE